MTPLLLFAILITLLGGWLYVGYAVLALVAIWIVILIILYISTFGEGSDSYRSPSRKVKIKQLERAIARKQGLGYDTKELELELDALRTPTPSNSKTNKSNAYEVSFGEGFLDAFTFGSAYEKRRLRRAIRHKKSLGYDTSELEERLKKL